MYVVDSVWGLILCCGSFLEGPNETAGTWVKEEIYVGARDNRFQVDCLVCVSSFLSVSLFTSIYLSIYLCIYLSFYLSFFLSFYLSFFGTQRRRSHFFLPVLSPFFPACSLVLSRLIYWETLSALLSKLKKIMDLINWSLNAIDTIFSTRSLGSGEPDCPDGTFAAGYTMDAWKGWRIVCLAALSVEDIEDIYLFGTMITGLSADRIRLCPGLSKNSGKREQLSKASQGCRHDWSSGKSGQHWDWDY